MFRFLSKSNNTIRKLSSKSFHPTLYASSSPHHCKSKISTIHPQIASPISSNAFDSSGSSSKPSDSRYPTGSPNGSPFFRALDRNSSFSGPQMAGNRFSHPESRAFSSEPDRESMEYDVVIVGAGPSGLSAAIRLKQMCRAKDVDFSVCVVEKGAEVGSCIFTSIPFDNKGNYIISLSQLVRWLGGKAEELGVEIYPGFAASEILYDANHNVIGIGTNDMGIAKDGSKKDNFQRGVELRGRVTLLAEGCRGSLSEKVLRDYNLREKAQAQHQTYALGIKEVSIGLVVALNYHNPFLNPYEEFQKLKHHPAIKPLLKVGLFSSMSIPYPVFPGGAIIGCSAGFLNVPKIKGTHTAMKSGMLAAEAAFDVLHEGSSMEKYWDGLRNSWIWEELHKARNYRPLAFEYGLVPGLALSALEHYVLKGRSPLTLKHGKPDHEATDVAQLHSPNQYPKPDGIVSLMSNTNHDHDQPSHLHLRDPRIPERVNLPDFAGPESRYCPARVYEYVPDEKGELRLQINAQNCLHCKACDIKDPKQNIEWTVPEGGGGPGYSVM
ncbi:hypothetical protein AAG906_009076 [Vitis piasezkii]